LVSFVTTLVIVKVVSFVPGEYTAFWYIPSVRVPVELPPKKTLYVVPCVKVGAQSEID
jgi:hypothetical protein